MLSILSLCKAVASELSTIEREIGFENTLLGSGSTSVDGHTKYIWNISWG